MALDAALEGIAWILEGLTWLAEARWDAVRRLFRR